jgi:hypothetical protein
MSAKRSGAPSFKAIAQAWNKDLEDIAHCFACGYTGSSEKSWMKASLIKAHIIPHALGGSNDPDNFVLLCFWCHELNPETLSGEYFLEWMAASPTSLGNTHYLALGQVHTWAKSLPGQPDPMQRDLTSDEFANLNEQVWDDLKPLVPLTPGSFQVIMIETMKRARLIVNGAFA